VANGPGGIRTLDLPPSKRLLYPLSYGAKTRIQEDGDVCAQNLALLCFCVYPVWMPRPRSVVDLLAEQSEDSLRQMKDSIAAELARLSVEAEQIDQALARKNRKSRTGGGRLTRDQVLDVLARADGFKTTAEVQAQIEAEGVPASVNAVRNHLTRLVQEGRLSRDTDGRFGIPPFVGPEGGVASDFVRVAKRDDDIPF
jgi:hypothetical protein